MSVLDEDTRRIGRMLHYGGLLVAVVCGTIAYSVAYAPTTKGIVDTSALIDELRQSVQNGPVMRREHEKAAQELRKVTQRLETLRQRVPSDAEAGEFLRQVTQIAAGQHLAISDFQPEKTTDKDGYVEMEVTLSGTGSYRGICSFFDELSKLPRLSKVKNLTLSAGSTPDEYPMKATLVIYFGLESSDAADTAADGTTTRKGVRRG